MKKVIIIMAVMGLLLSIHVSAHAQELNPRKGFTFTLEMPGIGFAHHADQDDGTVFSFAGALRFGYGFHEQLVLFVESAGNLGSLFSTNLDTNGIMLAAWNVGVQYFPMKDKNFFITPKLGLGFAMVLNEGRLVGSDREGAGFTGGLGTGYEWRFGKRFALSPEARFDYYNTGGASAWFSGVALNLQWY